MIVTKLYYDGTYVGTTLTEALFNKYNARAEDDIYSIAQFVYDDLVAFQQEYVKKAICAQIDYYAQNGETFNEVGAASETIGKFSYSAGTRSAQSGAFAPRARQYIELAGLMNRTIVRFDNSYIGGEIL